MTSWQGQMKANFVLFKVVKLKCKMPPGYWDVFLTISWFSCSSKLNFHVGLRFATCCNDLLETFSKPLKDSGSNLSLHRGWPLVFVWRVENNHFYREWIISVCKNSDDKSRNKIYIGFYFYIGVGNTEIFYKGDSNHSHKPVFQS